MFIVAGGIAVLQCFSVAYTEAMSLYTSLNNSEFGIFLLDWKNNSVFTQIEIKKQPGLNPTIVASLTESNGDIFGNADS